MNGTSPIETVRARIDLVDVVAPHVRLHRAGRELCGLCPFHDERTPSFYVNPEKQVWTCHGCHLGGDVFHFVELIEHVDFRAALEQLAQRVGVSLAADPAAIEAERRRRRERDAALGALRAAADYYHHVLVRSPAGAPGLAFLAERGVDPATRDAFHLGYAPAGHRADNLVRFLASRGHGTAATQAAGLTQRGPTGIVDVFRRRLVIPIRDEHGAVVAFGGRALDADPRKYLNSRNGPTFDKSRTLFGLDRAQGSLRSEATAVVVEGYFDVLAAHAAGVTGAVAACGTVFTPEHARLLRRFAPSVVLCFDGDGAGQRAAAEAVPTAVAAGLEARLAVLPEGMDPDDVCRTDPGGFHNLVAGARPAFEVLVDRALGDAGPGTGPGTLAARRAALAVLARVPEASERDLYAQRVGQRLGVDPRHLLEDLDRRGREPRGHQAAPTAPAAGPDAHGFVAGPAGNTPLGRTGYLLALLVQRPELARRAREFYGVEPEEFIDPHAQAVYRMLSTGSAVCAPPSDEAAVLLARLGRHEFPELEGADADLWALRALEDGVRLLRLQALADRARHLEQRIAQLEHHRQGEAPRLVAELDGVWRWIAALRQGAPPTDPVVAGSAPASFDRTVAGPQQAPASLGS